MNPHPSEFIDPNVFLFITVLSSQKLFSNFAIMELCYDHLNIWYRINTNKISAKCEIKIQWWAAFVNFEIMKMPRQTHHYTHSIMNLHGLEGPKCKESIATRQKKVWRNIGLCHRINQHELGNGMP